MMIETYITWILDALRDATHSLDAQFIDPRDPLCTVYCYQAAPGGTKKAHSELGTSLNSAGWCRSGDSNPDGSTPTTP